MVRSIFVHLRIGVDESELDPEKLKIVVLSRQEEPSGSRMKLLGKFLEHGRSVVFGVDGQGVHEDIAADTLAKELLHLHEVRRCQRTGVLATGIHEVYSHNFVSEQIIVETKLLAMVRCQRNVRKVQISNLVAGRDRGSAARRTRLATQQRTSEGSNRSRCDQLSSGYR